MMKTHFAKQAEKKLKKTFKRSFFLRRENENDFLFMQKYEKRHTKNSPRKLS